MNYNGGSEICGYDWREGNRLTGIKSDGQTTISYRYNHQGHRVGKWVYGVATEYYLDGGKILGEDSSDGTKLRYFYDAEGIYGFTIQRAGESNPTYYSYVKDTLGSIIMLKDKFGIPLVRYEYDGLGKCTLIKVVNNQYTPLLYPTEYYAAQDAGRLNPFRWKGHYYDAETESPKHAGNGLYYIDGRYYDPYMGGYLDAEDIGNVFADAYSGTVIDRNAGGYPNLLNLPPNTYAIVTMAELYADPNYDYNANKNWWDLNWQAFVSWAVPVVTIAVGVAFCFVPIPGFRVAGGFMIAGGSIGIAGNIISSQFSRGLGMGMTGIQSIITGISLIASCNPVGVALGIIGIVAGTVTTAFASAEIQEGLGYGNWIKDIGIDGGLYDGLMWGAYATATFVNIVGPIYK